MALTKTRIVRDVTPTAYEFDRGFVYARTGQRKGVASSAGIQPDSGRSVSAGWWDRPARIKQ
jgi:hypothetical protein